MPRDARAFLSDIIQACDAISEHIRGVDIERYLAQQMVRDAVERRMFIAGEAVNQLRKLEPLEIHTLGAVHRIITVRNILGHSYFAVGNALVWEIAVEHIPRRRIAAQQWLDHLEESKR